MQYGRDQHPNMLGTSIFAFILSATLFGLSFSALLRGEPLDWGVILLAALLGIGGRSAYRLHVRLKAMTLEERDSYWARVDAEGRANARSYARHMLGRDYEDKK